MNNLYFKSSIEVIFNIKDKNLSSTKLNDPFLKQAKYKLKNSVF